MDLGPPGVEFLRGRRGPAHRVAGHRADRALRTGQRRERRVVVGDDLGSCEHLVGRGRVTVGDQIDVVAERGGTSDGGVDAELGLGTGDDQPRDASRSS